MPRTEKYFVGPKLLGDIRKTITRVAGFPDSSSGPGFKVALQELQRRGSGSSVRMAEFTGAWAKNSYNTVTLTESTQTLSVNNILFPVPELSDSTNSPTYCAIARDRGTWQLIAVESVEHTVLSSVALQPDVLEFERRLVLAPGRTNSTAGITITECDDEAASAEQLQFFLG